MPLLQQTYEQESAKNDGVVWLTVNVQDTSATVKTFITDGKYTFPALVDAGGRVARAYGVSAIPVTYMINRDGTVRYVKRGKFLSINEVNVALNRIR
jgi:peroxiredoxin